jgi:hypothetical protein
LALIAMTAASRAQSDDRQTDAKGSKPVVELTIPSIKHTYDDLKLVFNLARDEKGYATFKETLDEFLVGVDAGSPCGVNVYMTKDGLATVVSAPVKDDAAFQKFVKNLWDLDVKSAPPPSPQMQRQVPKSVQDKLHSLKPQAHEKLLFGLMEGALLYEHGYVHLGPSLEAVRMARGQKVEASEKGGSLSIQILGDVEPARRHTAFEKSKQDILSRPKREDFNSDADFELAQAVVEYQLAKLELLVADASHVDAVYTVSREKKNSKFEAEVTPAANTPLAKDFSRFGQHPDLFAGVSHQNAVVSAAVNMPVDEALGKLMKVVAAKAHAAASARLDASSRLDANQVQVDKDFSNLIFQIATDVAGMDTCNGFLRTWSDSEGKLTTLVGTRISQVDKIRELLHKFKQSERVASIAGAETVKVTSAHRKKDAPELFDAEGSIFVATSDEAVWFALGPQAQERLGQAIQAAPHGKDSAKESGKSTGQPAIELRAEMRPLAQVWDAIGTRHRPRPEAKPASSRKSKSDSKTTTKSDSGDDTKADRKKAVSASAVTDLHLHKIAGESFKEQDGHFDLSLTSEGDKAKIVITSDEGVLRFVGKVLSEFTKQNLADN